MSASETTTASKPSASSDKSASAASGRPGGGMTAAAVVLALASLAAAGYALWQLQTLKTLPQQLQNSSGETARQYSELERQVATLTAQAGSSTAALTGLQAAAAEETAAMADLALQLTTLNQRVAELGGSNAARRNRFLRAEALYYLRIANAQVLLAREPGLAVSALQLADAKLREAGDPDLVPVRAKLSEEIVALQALPALDTTGISFRLQALAEQVPQWPLRNPVPDSFESELSVATAPDKGAWERLKKTVASVFDSIVSVRRTDAPPEVQLGQTETALLTEGVRAELRLARLTLISGNMELYALSLQSLQQQLATYFDTSAAAVSAAQATLAELAKVEGPGALPDVSGSLQLLLAAEADAAADGNDKP